MSEQYGPAEASFCELGPRLVAKYGWPVAHPHLFCRVVGFVFCQWDSGDDACLARLECYGHAPPDPHSGLPQIDLSVHSDVLILAEDLKRRVLVVPLAPRPRTKHNDGSLPESSAVRVEHARLAWLATENRLPVSWKRERDSRRTTTRLQQARPALFWVPPPLTPVFCNFNALVLYVSSCEVYFHVVVVCMSCCQWCGPLQHR